MGYTHYWRRPTQSISVDSMNKIVNDFNKIVLVLDDMGVRLADGFGENTPEINSDRLWFNGLAKCGHSPNQEVFYSVARSWRKKASARMIQRSAVTGSPDRCWILAAVMAIAPMKHSVSSAN